MSKKKWVQHVEQTLVLVKPDGVVRGLIGEIIKRFEQRGLKIIGLKMIKPNPELVGKHYLPDPEWLKSVGTKAKKAYEKKGVKVKESEIEIGKKIRRLLIDYLTQGPVVAMAIQGFHAVDVVRKIVGGTEPRTAPPGTIRGDFTVDSYYLSDDMGRPIKNVVHASGSVEEAKKELDVWFSPNELYSYERTDEKAAFHLIL